MPRSRCASSARSPRCRRGRPAALDVIAAPTTSLVTLTITEKGYEVSPDEPEPSEDPTSAPTLIALALARRRRRGLAPPVFASLDNLLRERARPAGAGRRRRPAPRSVLGGLDRPRGRIPELRRRPHGARSHGAGPGGHRPSTRPGRPGGREHGTPPVLDHRHRRRPRPVGRGGRGAGGGRHALRAEEALAAQRTPLRRRLRRPAGRLRARSPRRSGTTPSCPSSGAWSTRPSKSPTSPLPSDRSGSPHEALRRFANPTLGHTCAQVGADGSSKLPQRLVPVAAARRARGLGTHAFAAVAAIWIAATARSHGPWGGPPCPGGPRRRGAACRSVTGRQPPSTQQPGSGRPRRRRLRRRGHRGTGAPRRWRPRGAGGPAVTATLGGPGPILTEDDVRTFVRAQRLGARSLRPLALPRHPRCDAHLPAAPPARGH